jgi:hypothetical protein
MGRRLVILIALNLAACSQSKPESATRTAQAEAPSTQAAPRQTVATAPRPPAPAKPPPVLGDPYGLLSKSSKKSKLDPSTLDPGALTKAPEPVAPKAGHVQRDPRAVARASKPLAPPASSFAPVKSR